MRLGITLTRSGTNLLCNEQRLLAVNQRRLTVALDAELPWCGGWWLERDPEPGADTPTPRLHEGRVTVALPPSWGILSWRPGDADAGTAFRVDL